MREKQARIDKAIDRKEKQIAYFNSLNAAIQVATARLKKNADSDTWFGEIMSWREQFYMAWENWYKEEIASKEAPKLSKREVEAIMADLDQRRAEQLEEEAFYEAIREAEEGRHVSL